MAQSRPGSVTPKLSCASCQPSEMSGQYIARSTTIPRSAVTVVETGVLASSGSTVSTFTVSRALAGTVAVRVIVAPDGRR